MNRLTIICALAAALLATGCATNQTVSWPEWGYDTAATKYSPLTNINRSNVTHLQQAWVWKTGETRLPQYGTSPGMFEDTPLMIGDTLYVTTPYNRVVALDPVTGVQRWTYDPKSYVDGQPPNGTGYVHRGVVAWSNGNHLDLFLNTRYRLICLDASTGKPVPGFGHDGVVDLSQGLIWPINKLDYTETSPPVIYKDLVIVGNGVGDRLIYHNDPPGDVRAFDAHTGREIWSFHTIPQAGEYGNHTWGDNAWKFTGHTNVWAPMTLDTQRGLLYLPVSTPSNDFYGGARPGDNLFGETLVCLNAATGKRVWDFQIVHHGLWDYDLASPPVLLTITVGGKKIDAVVQPTKEGFLFVFNRLTGKPVWPIVERPVPASNVPGEHASPSQPFPTKPPAYTE
ncbi:MAG: PQQ-binding-like beta-propeller repeat protein, partial [Terriglobales bacterium]